MSSIKQMNRRDFIKLCGAGSLALAAPLSLVPLTEAAVREDRHTRTHLKMGTTVTVTLVTDSAGRADEAFNLAWREIDRLSDIFDRHRAGTAVSELNTNGRLSDPGPEMLAVLKEASDVYHLSDGAFDPTVLPLLNLIEASFDRIGRPPKDEALVQALAGVDFGTVRFDRGGVSLGGREKRISLDGVAKGYIVDKVGARIKRTGIQNALINAGGDILALGHRGDGRPWRVGIQSPFKSDEYLRVIDLSDRAVATSGSYEIYFDRKQKYHHLINPAAGRPANRVVSATTVAATAARADALSTAAFVRPATLKAVTACEGLLVNREGGQALTPGFKNLLHRS